MARSQEFNHDRDTFSSGGNLFKTTFIKDRVLSLISQNPGGDNIRITITKNVNNDDVYEIQVYREDTPLGNRILGDFPCPTQCIPPNDKESFAKHIDLYHVLLTTAYGDCKFINIHHSFLYVSSGVTSPTCAIYGVTQSGTNVPDARNERGDNVFIAR